MPRDFANRYTRQMVNGFAGDLAPVDPLAAGLTFVMSPTRIDERRKPTSRLQLYFVSSVPGLTCDMQLWIKGAGANWIQVGAPLLAVPQNRMVFVGSPIEDSDAHVQVTPSVALGVGDTIDMAAEEVD